MLKYCVQSASSIRPVEGTLRFVPANLMWSSNLPQVGFPHTAVLGRLPGTNVFRNVKQYPEAQQYPGILAVRIDAPLYYANVPVRSPSSS